MLKHSISYRIISPLRTFTTKSWLLHQKSYAFEDIKNLVTTKDSFKNNKVLVDVREPVELKEIRIPSAVNIPWNTSPGALGLPAEEFHEKFQFSQPNKDEELIFFCAKGIRAKAAAEYAEKLGYNKTGIYHGSIADWIANGGSDIK